MTRLRLPLRLARREVWRRPGRTALVALLVALPVAGMTAAVVVIRTDQVTPAEEWERTYGQADAVLFGTTDGRAPAFGQAVGGGEVDPGVEPVTLPEGTRSLSVTGTYRLVRTADGRRADLDIRDLSLFDPITDGIHDLVKGTAPTGPGEVALSATVARRLRVDVGEQLVLDRPSVTLEVVGLIEPVGCLSCSTMLVAPGQLGAIPDTPAPTVVQLLDLPAHLTGQARAELAMASGEQIWLREQQVELDNRADPSDASADPVRWSLVLGALVLTVAGIVISAAFAVGARRQLVTLGQLSASGAAPSTVRAALALQGTLTGVVGAVAGLVLAAAGLVMAQGLVERILDQRIAGYTVRVADVGLAAVIGVVAATLGALIPARTAAQIPTLSALAGRRPVAAVSRRLISAGVAAVVGGLGLLALAVVGSQSGQSGQLWAYVAILGGVAELLGACALAPALVARLEPLSGRLTGSWRLGARSLARHRSRTGAVVSAVAAAGALAVAASALIQGAEAQLEDGVRLPDDVVVVRRVSFDTATGQDRSTLPDENLRREVADLLVDPEEHLVRTVVVPGAGAQVGPGSAFWEVDVPGFGMYGSDLPLLADDAVFELLRADDALQTMVQKVGAVILIDEHLEEPVVIRLPDGRQVDAVAVRGEHTLGHDATVLVSPRRAAELGLVERPAALALRVGNPLTQSERDHIADIALEQSESDGFTELRFYSPPSGPSPLQVELILTGLALAFSLFVVGVSLALAAAESKDERDVLTIAGAPPATLARSAGARAWLLAAIGAVMSVPIGFLPVVVFATAGSGNEWPGEFPLIFPGRTALMLLVVVPVVVSLASWSASATAQRLHPVHVSTVTFE